MLFDNLSSEQQKVASCAVNLYAISPHVALEHMTDEEEERCAGIFAHEYKTNSAFKCAVLEYVGRLAAYVVLGAWTCADEAARRVLASPTANRADCERIEAGIRRAVWAMFG